METWRKIEDYDNYSISDLGNVRNDTTSKILKTTTDKDGYHYMNLYRNGKRKTFINHKLVACAFIDNNDNKRCVDHINNDRSDNRKENLRWATCQENNRNAKLKIDNTSGVKGVCYYKITKKWVAKLKIDGINIHLDYFDTIEEAKEARIRKANQVFGVFVNDCEKL